MRILHKLFIVQHIRNQDNTLRQNHLGHMSVIALKRILCDVVRLKWIDLKRLTQNMSRRKGRRLRQKSVPPIVQKGAIEHRGKRILLGARNHERTPLFVSQLKHIEGTEMVHLFQAMNFGKGKRSGQGSKEHLSFSYKEWFR